MPLFAAQQVPQARPEGVNYGRVCLDRLSRRDSFQVKGEFSRFLLLCRLLFFSFSILARLVPQSPFSRVAAPPRPSAPVMRALPQSPALDYRAKPHVNTLFLATEGLPSHTHKPEMVRCSASLLPRHAISPLQFHRHRQRQPTNCEARRYFFGGPRRNGNPHTHTTCQHASSYRLLFLFFCG